MPTLLARHAAVLVTMDGPRREIASIIWRWMSSAYTTPLGPTRRASRIVNHPLPAPRSATWLPSPMRSASMI